MPVSNAPIFTQTARAAQVQISTANTNRDGSTGTYSSAFSAGANGTTIDSIVFEGVGTVTNGVVRIFYSDDSGVTWRLLAEILVTATTPSTTVACWTDTWTHPSGQPWAIPSTGQLKFSTNNAETFNVFVNGADY